MDLLFHSYNLRYHQLEMADYYAQHVPIQELLVVQIFINATIIMGQQELKYMLSNR
jgi:hypothetical protein